MRASLAALIAAASLGAAVVPVQTSAQRVHTEIIKLSSVSSGQSGGLPASVPSDTRTDALRTRPRIRRDTRIKKAGPGWSNRQVQRTAAKARNVKRSKGKR
jgi:hypothetical protein